MVAGEVYDRTSRPPKRSRRKWRSARARTRPKSKPKNPPRKKNSPKSKPERARAAAEIPENLLDHYDRIVKKHDGIALAEVRERKMQRLRHAHSPACVSGNAPRTSHEEMFHCETCTRILYYIEPAASAAAAAPPTTPPAAPRRATSATISGAAGAARPDPLNPESCAGLRAPAHHSAGARTFSDPHPSSRRRSYTSRILTAPRAAIPVPLPTR